MLGLASSRRAEAGVRRQDARRMPAVGDDHRQTPATTAVERGRPADDRRGGPRPADPALERLGSLPAARHRRRDPRRRSVPDVAFRHCDVSCRRGLLALSPAVQQRRLPASSGLALLIGARALHPRNDQEGPVENSPQVRGRFETADGAHLVENGYLKDKGWIASVLGSMPVDASEQPIPWYTYGAIDFLAGRVKDGMRVFEYGSGNSTLWWSGRTRQVVSCEHDKAWYDVMKGKVPANVDYTLIELDRDGSYANAVAGHADPFDVVVIDGRDRINCAKASLTALKPDGVIVWDNSDRPDYDAGYRFLPEPVQAPRLLGDGTDQRLWLVHFGVLPAAELLQHLSHATTRA